MQIEIFPYNLTTTELQTGQSLKTLKPHNLITLTPYATPAFRLWWCTC